MVAQKGAEQQRLNRQLPLPGTMKVHVNAKMKAIDDQSSLPILVCGVKSLSGGDATAIGDTCHTIPKYMYFAIHTEISSTSMYSMSGQ